MPSVELNRFTDSPSPEVVLLSHLQGGSCSFLVEDDRKERWVIKPRPNGQGPYLASNEVTAAKLLKQLGLPSAPWRATVLPASLVQLLQTQKCLPWVPDVNLPQFSSRYAGDFLLQTQTMQSIRPSNSEWIQVLLGIYVFDVWAGHVDQRECLTGICRVSGICLPVPIDNGHMFFGPCQRFIGYDQKSMRRVPVAIESLVCDTRYDRIIARWIHTLQAILPDYISTLRQDVTRDWGTNNLFLNLEVFRKRLSELSRIVAEHRKDLATIKEAFRTSAA